MQICARYGPDCAGSRLTWEHALIYGHNQVQEPWAILPLCEFHHAANRHQDGPGLNKEINLWIALNRATTKELELYSKAINYVRERERLNTKYGEYVAPAERGIMYELIS